MSKQAYVGLLVVVSFLICWQSYSLHKGRMANGFSLTTMDAVNVSTASTSAPRNEFSFLLDGKHKCAGRTPFLVLLIPSSPEDSVTRHAIRKTWGNETLLPGVDILRIFLVGAPHPRTVFTAMQAVLRNESDIFGDVIQQDFLDTYNNLTLKTMMGMEWVARFCPNASYVMKIDSDMFFNPVFLVNQLLQPNLPVKKNYFTGKVIRQARPFRVNTSKWFVSSDEYAKEVYPTYCSGTGYALSGDLATKVYHVAPHVQRIHMEDVFMGLCLEKLGIQVTDPPLSVFNGERVDYERCRFTKLITVHHYDKDEVLRLWPDFLEALKTC
ncbi:beta-1,3-galactosyltransferase 2-like [Ambystoma mexicanum]|uniref:beta-1,3-galactosyltransferase 2-like n=1 Tax=Ambystoma mexicanum TaxID=8296 RepID=UPI0037E712EE